MAVLASLECLATAARTLVVQPDALCREGLSRLLRELPGLCVMPPVASAAATLALAGAAGPDLVVTDIDLPAEDGLGFIAHLLRLPHPPVVVVVTRQTGGAYVRAALGVGARAFLPRNASPDELEEALRRALRGQLYIHHTLAADLLEITLDSGGRELTERECALLFRLSRGETNREIAQALFLSEKTVRNTLTRLFQKLRVRNRTEALAVARESGYL